MQKNSLRRWNRPLVATLIAAVAVASALLPAVPAGAVVMGLQPTTATVERSGDSARLCVELGGEGVTVAGTQNDIAWDGDCATLIRCQASPTAGKPLSANVRPNSYFTLTAIMLSLGDLDPIPDGPLYCCDFRIETAEPGSCCSFSVQRARVSDPQARGADARGMGAQICLGDSGVGGGSRGGIRRGAPAPVGGIVAGPGTQAGTGAADTGESSGAPGVGGVRRSVPTPELPPIGGVAAVEPAQGGGTRPEAPAPAAQRAAGETSFAEADERATPAGSPSLRAAASPVQSASPAVTGAASPAAVGTVEKSPAAPVATKAPATKVPTKRAAVRPSPTPEKSSGCLIVPTRSAQNASFVLLLAALGLFVLGRRR